MGVTRRAALAAIAGLCSLVGVGAALADYPERPITMIVPFAAGGQFSNHAFVVAEELEKILGQTVVVEHMPGAGSRLAAEHVSKQAPDGYTIFMAGSGILAIAPHQYKDLPFKVEEFAPISMLNYIPVALLVNPSMINVKNLDEFITHVKANPGAVTYGSPGFGATTHLIGELIESHLGLDMEAVHYQGSAPSRADLIGGHLPVDISAPINYADELKSGKAIALAINGDKRLDAYPDIPTFTELGHPELAAAGFAAFVAPKGTPPEITEVLSKAIAKALEVPSVRDRLVSDATIPAATTPAEMREIVQRDTATWKKAIDTAGIKFD